MSTVAIEFVPPSLEGGRQEAIEIAQKAHDLSRSAGLLERLNAVLIPGMIEEEAERPVALKPKLDPLDTFQAVSTVLPLEGILTQVTPFSTPTELEQRVEQLREAGIERIVFVGVPRTMADGEGEGLSPVEALDHFRDRVPHRGAILIPTRPDEISRFQFKLNQGANFALTQLLFSDAITRFASQLAETSHRPEILLSFGYVPKAEERVGLIQWLIQDTSPEVQAEMAFVKELATMEFAPRKQRLVELYKRVIDGLHQFDLPFGLHLECPYGFSKPAMETFHAMLDVWCPE